MQVLLKLLFIFFFLAFSTGVAMASSEAAFAGGVVYLGPGDPAPAGRVVRIWAYGGGVPMWDAAALLRMVFKNNPRVRLGWG